MRYETERKFGFLYKGEWIYDTSLGVGIELKGTPVDSDEFIKILKEHNCNEVAALRILNDLLTIGERKVTVMYQLNFLNLYKSLLEIGIEMSIIAPGNHSSNKYFQASAMWDKEIELILAEKLNLEEVLKTKLPIERKIFMERYEAAILSIALLEVSETNK